MPGPTYQLNSLPKTGYIRGSWKSIFLLLVVAFLLGGCARDYVSGRPTLTMISEEEEVALGMEYDKQIVAQYGLYEDPDLAAFVNELGQEMAAISQRSHLEYHFRVLDDGVVNAFALPGGYIYMPRGILAFFNSEDQLAGVLGHETGHVVARHSVEQMSQRVLFTGFGLTDRLAQRFPVIGGVATAPINLGLLKYSRDQENESDRLGVEYSTRIGYDAHTMADFFHTLGAMSTQSGHAGPTYLSSHPHPEDRYEKVNQLADEWQAKVDFKPRGTEPIDYLRRIDGMVYGQDPRQGFTEDGVFYHPSLGFGFSVPADWKLANTASRVIVVAPDEKALVAMGLADAPSASTAADAFVAEAELQVTGRRLETINELSVAIVESIHVEGRQRTRMLSHFVAVREVILVFHTLSAESDFPTHANSFERLLGSVARITDHAILDVEPRRVRIVQAQTAGDLAAVFADLGVPEDEHLEMANMNGRNLQDPIAKGDWLKIVH
jgi:predicted Zn-dependent protease